VVFDSPINNVTSEYFSLLNKLSKKDQSYESVPYDASPVPNALLDLSLTDGASTIVTEFAGQAEELVSVKGFGLLTVASQLFNKAACNRRLENNSWACSCV
jgi:hypothetical protein